MATKEYAYRVQIKYYDNLHEQTRIKFLFCTAEDNSEIDILDYAYNKYFREQPDISKYKIVKYDFHNFTNLSTLRGLSVQAFDYAEIYS